jgi:hypothetical protein
MAYVPPAARRSTTPGTPATRSLAGTSPRSGRGAARDGKTAAAPPGRSRGTFLAGLGIGVAIGAAVALLLAPQSGADTRRALRRRGQRVRSKASDAWEDLRVELARAKRALRRKRREARDAREPATENA